MATPFSETPVHGAATVAARGAPRRRMMVALFSTQGLFRAAVIGAVTLSPILTVELSGSMSTAGRPNTIGLAGRALMAAPAGLLLDRASRRLGHSFGYLIGAAGAALGFYAIRFLHSLPRLRRSSGNDAYHGRAGPLRRPRATPVS